MTELVYLTDFNVFECTARVLEIRTDDGETTIILDRTVLYPRGGGQDWDTGTLASKDSKFIIEEVRLDETGTVLHKGRGEIAAGDTVAVAVDIERRTVNTRLHSGGHLLDMAISNMHPSWVPAKGAHYPHMSFVEYNSLQDLPSEDAKDKITEKVDDLMQQSFVNSVRLVDRSELDQLCRHVPAHIPSNKPTRVVLYGDFGVPCGGTHVSSSQEIGKLEVIKVKTKKGITKVSYRIEGIN